MSFCLLMFKCFFITCTTHTLHWHLVFQQSNPNWWKQFCEKKHWRNLALNCHEQKHDECYSRHYENIITIRSWFRFSNITLSIIKHAQTLFRFYWNSCSRCTTGKILHLQSVMYYGLVSPTNLFIFGDVFLRKLNHRRLLVRPHLSSWVGTVHVMSFSGTGSLCTQHSGDTLFPWVPTGQFQMCHSHVRNSRCLHHVMRNLASLPRPRGRCRNTWLPSASLASITYQPAFRSRPFSSKPDTHSF